MSAKDKVVGLFNSGVEQAKQAANQLKTNYIALSAAANDAQKSIRKMSNEFVQQVSSSKEAERVVTSLKDSYQVLAKTGKGAKESIKGIADKLKITPTGVISSIKTEFLDLIKTGDEFDKFKRKLTSALGSVSESEQAVDWLREFNRTTPLELQDLADSFIELKNYGIDPTSGVMQAISDQTVALGSKTSTLNKIVGVLGKAYQDGKLEVSGLNKLMSEGVDVYDLLASATGKNTGELQELAKSGGLGKEAIDQLLQAMGKANEGQGSQAMGEISNQVSVLVGWYDELKEKIFNGGVGDFIKQELASVLDSINEMSKNGSLDDFAKRTASNIVDTFQGIKSGITAFKDAVEPTINTVITAFNLVTLTVKGFGVSFTGILQGVLSGATEIADALGLESARSKLQGATDAMSAINTGFINSVNEDINDIKNAWSDGSGHVGKKSSEMATDVGKNTAKMANEVANNTTKMSDSASINFERVGSEAESLTNKLGGESKRASSLIAEDSKFLSEQFKNTWQYTTDNILKSINITANDTSKVLKDTSGEIVRYSDGVQGLASTSLEASPKVKALFTAFSEATDADVAVSQLATGLENLGSTNGVLEAVAKMKSLKDSGEITTEQYNSLKSVADTALDSIIEKTTTATAKHGEESEALTQKQLSYQAHQQKLKELEEHEAKIEAGQKAADEDKAARLNSYAGLMDSLANKYRGMSDEAYSTYSNLVEYSANYGLGTSLQSYYGRLSRGLDGLNASIAEQENRAASLTEQLSDTSGVSKSVIARAERAIGSMNYLGEQQLGPLRSALADAVNKNRQLEESASSTLFALQNEYDQLKNNRRAIEERNYAAQKARLEAQREEAKGNSDAEWDLRKAESLASKLHRERLRQIAEEEAAEKKRKQEAEAAKKQEAEDQKRKKQSESSQRQEQMRSVIPEETNNIPSSVRKIVIEKAGTNSAELYATPRNEKNLLNILEDELRIAG